MAEILLCVSGSIACYKAADVASRLTHAGHRVTAVLSRGALKLIGAHTFRAVTGQPVYTRTFDPRTSDRVDHVALADRTDLVLLCPATANVIAKLAHGIADDLVTTTLLATDAPLLVCPAMNDIMWAKPATRRNVEQAIADGARIVPPESGDLACGRQGTGRLADPARIVAEVERMLAAAGKRAGPRDVPGGAIVV